MTNIEILNEKIKNILGSRYSAINNNGLEIMKAKKEKSKRGGKRKNAGRKSVFNEQTKTVSFRCPLSKNEELKLYVTDKLSEWSQGGI